MSRPSVDAAQTWNPEWLLHCAEGWHRAATSVESTCDTVSHGSVASHRVWTGWTADAAREQLTSLAAESRQLALSLRSAAAIARDATDRMVAARDEVIDVVERVRASGFSVADDGTVSAPELIPDRIVASGGGNTALIRQALTLQAERLTTIVVGRLDRLGELDSEAAQGIARAQSLAQPEPGETHPTIELGGRQSDPATVVSAWSTSSQDAVATQIAAMTPQQRQQLVDQFPQEVGNTNGVPWEMRIAANRINIATAIADEADATDDDEKLSDVLRRFSPVLLTAGGNPLGTKAFAERVWSSLNADPHLRQAVLLGEDTSSEQRVEFYRGLLQTVPDPADPSKYSERQIISFDPDQSSLIELTGDLQRATRIGVLVPGTGTTIEGSAANTETAQRFVDAGAGKVAMITYLGGPFPPDLIEAADSRYAIQMAPRLMEFSHDVDRTVDSLGRDVEVTYIGHSYGGSVLGTAEGIGLTADRTLYVASAGAGFGIEEAGDWHNHNPDVERFAMTAPVDPISLVQGSGMSPHGADVDDIHGVTRLPTGFYDNGLLMYSLPAHSDVINEPSDAWRNILGVITGG